jgi:hypothetical protein
VFLNVFVVVLGELFEVKEEFFELEFSDDES